MFTVTDPVADRAILTLDEIKAATGETGSANDAELTSLGLQAADAIANFCGFASDGVNPPTLFPEELTETFRLKAPGDGICWRPMELMLARRPVTAVDSVTEDGVALDEDYFEIEVPTGILRRLNSTGLCYAAWPLTKIVVVYTAGYAAIPEPVKLAAKTLCANFWAGRGRDPLLRNESHEGLGSFGYFQAPLGSDGSTIPQSVAELLAPYRAVR